LIDGLSYGTEANSQLRAKGAIRLSLLMQGDDASFDYAHLRQSMKQFLVIPTPVKYEPKN
jgi:hypothetical protein